MLNSDPLDIDFPSTVGYTGSMENFEKYPPLTVDGSISKLSIGAIEGHEVIFRNLEARTINVDTIQAVPNWYNIELIETAREVYRESVGDPYSLSGQTHDEGVEYGFQLALAAINAPQESIDG